jgi:NTP pyrophosphatase (non-canonical NTP hydrolase)
MSQHDNLEARVTELEARVRELYERVRSNAQDAAAARVLAGGADRDVHEVRDELRDFRRAVTSSFNAMREEMNSKFEDVDRRFVEVHDKMDNGFAEVRGRLDATAAGQQQIVTMLNVLIAREGDQPNNH